MALERALVDVVNKVGVDINRAANDEYYAALLPYVAGLGPRKAQVLIRKVVALVSFNVVKLLFTSNAQQRVEIL